MWWYAWKYTKWTSLIAVHILKWDILPSYPLWTEYVLINIHFRKTLSHQPNDSNSNNQQTLFHARISREKAPSSVPLLFVFQMDPVQKAVINHTFGVSIPPKKKQVITCNICQLRFNSDVSPKNKLFSGYSCVFIWGRVNVVHVPHLLQMYPFLCGTLPVVNMEREVILAHYSSACVKVAVIVLCFAQHSDGWLKLAPVQPFRVQVATIFINHTKQGKCANVWWFQQTWCCQFPQPAFNEYFSAIFDKMHAGSFEWFH